MNRKLTDTLLRNGIYYFNKRVPADLIDTKTFGGRKLVQRSLKTRDPRVARRLVNDHDVEFQRRCRLARQELNGAGDIKAVTRLPSKPHVPTDQEVTDALERFQLDFLAQNHRVNDTLNNRVWGDANDPIFAGLPSSRWEDIIASRARAFDGKPDNSTTGEVDRLATRYGWHLEKGSEPYLDICQRLAAAWIDAINRLGESKRGDSHREYREAITELPKTLAEAVDHYKATKAGRAEMIKKLDTAFRAWNELAGKQSISDISRRDIRQFISDLQQVPCTLRAKQASRNLRDLILDPRAKDPSERRLSPRSIKDNYLTPLSTAINQLREDYPNETNPFHGIKVDGASRKANTRKFKTEELNRIFQHPIFTGCRSRGRRNSAGSLIIQDHYYWGPIVAMWTGMRANEIATLQVNQVAVPELGFEGLPHIKVLEGKTDNARRDVPIHPRLLELGFGQYVAKLKSAGHERVFPQWTKPKGKSLSSGASQKNFNNRVLEGFAAGASFHTFRHTLKTEMAGKHNPLPEQYQRAILGHEQLDRDADYLHLELEDYYQAFVDGVQFEGVELSHLISPERAKNAN